MKTFELFDFQNQFIADIGKAFRRKKKVIGQLATGGGKGVVLAEIARRSIEKGNDHSESLEYEAVLA